MTWKPHIGV